ncbi:hypothetical protein TRIP_B330379 [uncultured Desulfatiglans sp.]|nr:hypothetical protein TRIP_B330379 [uncultured Desulfatiglans sp.]
MSTKNPYVLYQGLEVQMVAIFRLQRAFAEWLQRCVHITAEANCRSSSS